MADTLKTIIGADTVRPNVVEQCVQLVESEVSDKGLIIRGAFKTVQKIKPGFVKGAVDGLLDEWLENLEPYYSTWKTDNAGGFAEYLTGRKSEVADDLLKVTDARAEKTSHRTAAKMYGKLRSSAMKNVMGAVPGLGKLLETHLQAR